MTIPIIGPAARAMKAMAKTVTAPVRAALAPPPKKKAPPRERSGGYWPDDDLAELEHPGKAHQWIPPRV